MTAPSHTVTSPTVTSPTVLTARHLLQVQMADDPQISPDGRQVAWVHSWMDAPTDGYRSVLCVTDTETGAVHRLTDENGVCTHPRWSPDGARLAYLARATDGGAPGAVTQLCIAPSTGGTPMVAAQFAHSVTEPVWSPAGDRIVCTALLDPLKGLDTGLTPVDEADLYTRFNQDVHVAHRRKWKMDGFGYVGALRRTLVLIDCLSDGLAGGEPTVTTLVAGEHDLFAPAWSPDGAHLAVVGNLDADADAVRRQHIYLLDTGDSAATLQKLTTLEDIRQSRVAWSPDGSRLAVAGHNDPTLGHYGNQQLWIVHVETGAKDCVTADLDWTLGHAAYTDVGRYGGDDGLRWLPDGQRILALVSRGGDVRATIFDLPTGAALPVTSGEMTIAAFSIDQAGARMAALARAPLNPGDLYCYDLTGHLPAAPQRLTAVNDDWLGAVQLSTPEKFQFERDGVTVDAWILPPVGTAPDATVPAVLYTGGGPAGMRADNFMFEYQLLAAQGYAVIFCNARGCQGYGQDFCTAILGSWGGHDYADNLQALETACAAYPYIDETRLGIAGGSYGGYLVNWAIGHTDRFRAAVSDRSVFNRHASFGTSDIGHLREFEFDDGPPWVTGEKYRAQSPLSFIDGAGTPTLVVHSARDLRCAVEQGEQLYLALKRLGVPTEFVRFPNESHGLSRGGRPWHRVYRLQSYLDWFSRWL